MKPETTPPLFVCYVPGLDARLIDERTTPHLESLRRDHDVAEILTLPNTELLPTMVTGVWPHQHRIWQVSLRPEFRRPRAPGLFDLLPDILVTTAQCARQYVDDSYDLAAVPHRRRRRFRQHRFKYTRRAESDAVLARFGEYTSVLGMLAPDSAYVFTKDFDDLQRLGRELPTGRRRLELIEMYALDLTQHWNLDDPGIMREALRRTDAFVGRARENAARRGVSFLVLVDHGQEPVVGTVPLKAALRETGVSEREYSHFIELALARFWFHTERARRLVTERLAEIEHATLLTWREMHAHHVAFEDDRFGELYASADAGRVFFPHDFYQPLANLFLGLTDRHQRRRSWNPVHRGNHGYLSHYPSERGWMALAEDAARRTVEEAELVDVAPTLLTLVGREPAPYMTGRPVFVR